MKFCKVVFTFVASLCFFNPAHAQQDLSAGSSSIINVGVSIAISSSDRVKRAYIGKIDAPDRAKMNSWRLEAMAGWDETNGIFPINVFATGDFMTWSQRFIVAAREKILKEGVLDNIAMKSIADDLEVFNRTPSEMDASGIGKIKFHLIAPRVNVLSMSDASSAGNWFTMAPMLGVATSFEIPTGKDTEGFDRGLVATIGLYEKYTLTANNSNKRGFSTILRLQIPVSLDSRKFVYQWNLRGHGFFEKSGRHSANLIVDVSLLGGMSLLKTEGERLFLDIPHMNILLDISALKEKLSADLLGDATPTSVKDASKQRVSLSAKEAIDTLTNGLTEKIPQEFWSKAQDAVLLATSMGPMVAKVTSTLKWIQAIREIRSATAVRLLSEGALRSMAVGDLLMALGESLDDPAVVEYILFKRTSIRSEIYSALKYSDYVIAPETVSDWVNTKANVTYADVLDILQAASVDENVTKAGRQEALDTIERIPELRFLNNLEDYAIHERGFKSGVIGMDAATLAEALFQAAPENEKQQVLDELSKGLGMFRAVSDPQVESTWWVANRDVPCGDGKKPIASQKTAWDTVAKLWRTQDEQREIELERKRQVVLQICEPLGVHMAPEVFSKK